MEKNSQGTYGLRLTDFGITEVTRIATKTTQESAKGNLRWMAPEIIDPPDNSRGTLTSRTDTYSFAMTCVEVRDRVLTAPSIVFILIRFFLDLHRSNTIRGDPS